MQWNSQLMRLAPSFSCGHNTLYYLLRLSSIFYSVSTSLFFILNLPSSLIAISSFDSDLSIHNSIVPILDKVQVQPFDESKLTTVQQLQMEYVKAHLDEKLRLMSYNMLSKEHESRYVEISPWEYRIDKLIQLIQLSHCDLLCSQELDTNQTQDLLKLLGSTYACVGYNLEEFSLDIATNAIYYRVDRLKLLDSESQIYVFPFSDIEGEYQTEAVMTYCHFEDQATLKHFAVINTQLSSECPDIRLLCARALAEFIQKLPIDLPVILSIDLNAFPFRPDLALPSYDNQCLIRCFKRETLEDAREVAYLGSLGPSSTVSFLPPHANSKERIECTIDYVFTNPFIGVINHAIEPAQMDDMMLSTHRPVLIDFFMPDPLQKEELNSTRKFNLLND